MHGSGRGTVTTINQRNVGHHLLSVFQKIT